MPRQGPDAGAEGGDPCAQAGWRHHFHRHHAHGARSRCSCRALHHLHIAQCQQVGSCLEQNNVNVLGHHVFTPPMSLAPAA